MTITLDDPAFGAPATGVATASNLPLVGTATASGTADTWKAFDGAGTQVMSGNVGTTDESMILDSVTITSGNAYAITSWTHTQPA